MSTQKPIVKREGADSGRKIGYVEKEDGIMDEGRVLLQDGSQTLR